MRLRDLVGLTLALALGCEGSIFDRWDYSSPEDHQRWLESHTSGERCGGPIDLPECEGRSAAAAACLVDALAAGRYAALEERDVYGDDVVTIYHYADPEEDAIFVIVDDNGVWSERRCAGAAAGDYVAGLTCERVVSSGCVDLEY